MSLASKKAKGKRRGAVDLQVLEDEDVEGWHNCDLVSSFCAGYQIETISDSLHVSAMQQKALVWEPFLRGA